MPAAAAWTAASVNAIAMRDFQRELRYLFMLCGSAWSAVPDRAHSMAWLCVAEPALWFPWLFGTPTLGYNLHPCRGAGFQMVQLQDR
jgi:hypothetical protein